MKSLLYIIITLLVALIVVVIILTNNSPSETEPETSQTTSEAVQDTIVEPTAPIAPDNLIAEPMSISIINIYWSDNSNNEEGFRLYRDGTLIINLPANTTMFQDTDLEQATMYQYRVTAFNQIGETTTQVVSTRTLNPPIAVRLHKIGVHDNGEDFIRDNDGGEIYIGIVITDGGTTREQKLPTADGQFFTLYDDDIIDIETVIYSTDEIGNYLRIAILGYESDGGTGESLLYEALGIAVNMYLTGGTATILGIDTGLDNLIGRIFGADDDYLGSYEKAWYNDENWGTGTYSDIPCYMKDGTIGLRLWFTIETG